MRLRWGRARTSKRRVAIIGLDCAEPSLLFDRWGEELPNLSGLRRAGIYGELESVIPAITVPAWSCMTSGKDPGTLGVYGFRNRGDHTYARLTVADSRAIHEPRLWDILTRAGLSSIVLGVPGTYPPRPIDGVMVGCFLAPDLNADYTFPAGLKVDITRWVGEYQTDVRQFRTENKAWLLEQIQAMTWQRFELARRLLSGRDWDLFMMVEIGLDRMHHAFWSHMDPLHRRHVPGSPFGDAIRHYYHLLDAEIGRLMKSFDDQTVILVVSDHGAQRMDGGICLNEWLIREGYLVLAESVDASRGPVKFEDLKVDWRRTRAWGDGGYYGRVFINLEGREPEGAVRVEAYEQLRDELAVRLEALGDERGQPIGTRCYYPEKLYPRVNGVAPDLLVYFGNLAWRSIGTVGWDALHVFVNDTGPDDANHSQRGVLIGYDAARNLSGQVVTGMHLLQVAPTVLRLLGLEVPEDMRMPPIEALTRA